MKNRSLLGVILTCAVLGAYCTTKPQTTSAEPTPMFIPILREIQTQLPKGWVMRLPSRVNISDNRLYPEVATAIREEFAVFLNSQPNCKAKVCKFGIITVAQNSTYANNLRSQPIFSQQDIVRVRAIKQRDFQTLTEADKELVRRSDGAVLERTPIALKQGIEGLFIVKSGAGASTPPGASVIWKQDGLNYRASRGVRLDHNGRVTQRDRSNLIDLAISMANEPPIKSVR